MPILTTVPKNYTDIQTSELPYQTYERITGKKWTGGTSPEIVNLLKQANITYTPGTAEANLALQKYLLEQEKSQKEQQIINAQLQRAGLAPEVSVSQTPSQISQPEIPKAPNEQLTDLYSQLIGKLKEGPSDEYKKYKTDYENYQKQLLDINKAIQDAEAAERMRIKQTGEPVSEALLKSAVAEKQAPLMLQANLLLNQANLAREMLGLAKSEQEKELEKYIDAYKYGIDYLSNLSKLTTPSEEVVKTFTDDYGNILSVVRDKKTGEFKTLNVGKAGKKATSLKSSTGANYNTRLNAEISNLYSGRYGTIGAREKVINILKNEFPNVDVAKDIYNRAPDGWEANIKRLTASNIDQSTLNDLISDIKAGATLQQLYEAYPDVSPSLIQSIYYNQ